MALFLLRINKFNFFIHQYTLSKPVLWSALTEGELDTILESGIDSLLLPVGATEQHGPHLATGTDTIIAGRLCNDVSAQTGVPVLPALPYGCSLGHSYQWNGTIPLEPQILIDVITQIGDAVWKHGFRKLFIVNGHVTNFAPLRCALEQLRSQNDGMMVAVLDTARLSDTIEGHFCDDAQDWHANRGETSVMMHMACDHVREGLRAQSDDPDRTEGLVFSHPVNKTSLNGVTGQPSLSSKDEGEQLWTAMLEKLHHLVLKGMKEEPPLSAPYHRTSPTS